MMARDAFYVGYLPLPATLRRLVFVGVPLLLIAGIGLAVVMTTQQNNPGDGTWDVSDKTVIHGVLKLEPYPLVESPSGEWTLLVGMAKTSVADVPGALVAKPVEVEGYPIGRERTVLLTIESPDDIRSYDLESLDHAPEEALSVATALRGVIIDPKCYFGAMKPGEGKVHKACATLCIAGGIPPMFMTEDDSGQRSYYLLASAVEGQRGQGIRGDDLDALLPYVADPIQIKGEVVRMGTPQVLLIDPRDIRRVDPGS